MCLFEDWNVQLHGRTDARRPRRAGIQLLPSLATATPELCGLAVSFLTDAIDCFGLRDYLFEGGEEFIGERRIRDEIRTMRLTALTTWSL